MSTSTMTGCLDELIAAKRFDPKLDYEDVAHIHRLCRPVDLREMKIRHSAIPYAPKEEVVAPKSQPPKVREVVKTAVATKPKPPAPEIIPVAMQKPPAPVSTPAPVIAAVKPRPSAPSPAYKITAVTAKNGPGTGTQGYCSPHSDEFDDADTVDNVKKAPPKLKGLMEAEIMKACAVAAENRTKANVKAVEKQAQTPIPVRPSKSVAEQFKKIVAEKAKQENEAEAVERPLAKLAISTPTKVETMAPAGAAAKPKPRKENTTKVMSLEDLMIECETLQCWALREEFRKINSLLKFTFKALKAKAKCTEGTVYGCKIKATCDKAGELETNEAFGDTQTAALENALKEFKMLYSGM